MAILENYIPYLSERTDLVEYAYREKPERSHLAIKFTTDTLRSSYIQSVHLHLSVLLLKLCCIFVLFTATSRATSTYFSLQFNIEFLIWMEEISESTIQDKSNT